MATIKKIYQIKIVSARPGIWYEKKVGQQFEAEKSWWNGGGFLVNGTHFIHKEDVEVLSEKTVE